MKKRGLAVIFLISLAAVFALRVSPEVFAETGLTSADGPAERSEAQPAEDSAGGTEEEGEADGAQQEKETVRLEIMVDGHGSVNGRTEDFVQEMEKGASCTLLMSADEGYLTGEVLVNEEPLPEQERKAQIGKAQTELVLERLREDAEVSVRFAEKPAEAAALKSSSAAASPSLSLEKTSPETETAPTIAGQEGSRERMPAKEWVAKKEETKSAGSGGAGSEETDRNKTEKKEQVSADGETGGKGSETGKESAPSPSAEKDSSPKTGDSFPKGAAALLAALAGAGILFTGRRLRQ